VPLLLLVRLDASELSGPIVALVARVGLLSRVTSHVRDEIALAARAKIAGRALEQLLSRVRAHVCLEVAILGGSEVAHLTLEGLLTSVHPHVRCQRVRLPGSVVAVRAQKLSLSLPRVDENVPLQQGFVIGVVAALHAVQWSLSSVQTVVLVHGGRVSTMVTAQFAKESHVLLHDDLATAVEAAHVTRVRHVLLQCDLFTAVKAALFAFERRVPLQNILCAAVEVAQIAQVRSVSLQIDRVTAVKVAPITHVRLVVRVPCLVHREVIFARGAEGAPEVRALALTVHVCALRCSIARSSARSTTCRAAARRGKMRGSRGSATRRDALGGVDSLVVGRASVVVATLNVHG
jgi:hypothetical protein